MDGYDKRHSEARRRAFGPDGRLAALGVVAIGAMIPASRLAHALGFQPLPVACFAALAGIVVGYRMEAAGVFRATPSDPDGWPEAATSRTKRQECKEPFGLVGRVTLRE